jgi:hypothetical protein
MRCSADKLASRLFDKRFEPAQGYSAGSPGAAGKSRFAQEVIGVADNRLQINHEVIESNAARRRRAHSLRVEFHRRRASPQLQRDNKHP